VAKIAQPFKCDVCDALKQPSNNWFLGFSGKTFSLDVAEGEVPYAKGQFVTTQAIVVIPWNEAGAEHQDASHLCGIECVTKFVARVASTLQQESPNDVIRPH